MPLLGHPCEYMEATINQDAVIESIRNTIETYTCLEKQENGYVGEVYVDYRDKLSEENIKKIARSDSPMETFYDIFDGIEDAHEYSYVSETIKDNWDESLGEYDVGMILCGNGFLRMFILISLTNIF